MAEINGIKVPFVPIVGNEEVAKRRVGGVRSNFESIFKEELEKVKISNHAQKRLEARNIKLSGDDMNKIENAVKLAETKGSRDSLVMMNDTAFIVNVPNKTIVTTMQLEQTGENIFTNIDSVIFT